MAQGLLDEREFSDFAATQFRENPHVSVVLLNGSLELSIVLGDGANKQEHQINLANAYLEYRSEPTEIIKIVGHFVDSYVDFHRLPPAHDASQLLPIIRSIEYISTFPASAASSNAIIFEKIAADMVIIYAFDSPNVLTIATSDDLKNIDVQPSALKQRAIANLRSTFLKSGFHAQIAGNEYLKLIGAGGAYQTSVLLLDDFWTKKQFPFKGDLVVYVLARETMLVTGSGELEGLRFAEQFTAKEWPGLSYQISRKPIVRRDGGWVAFEP